MAFHKFAPLIPMLLGYMSRPAIRNRASTPHRLIIECVGTGVWVWMWVYVCVSVLNQSTHKKSSSLRRFLQYNNKRKQIVTVQLQASMKMAEQMGLLLWGQPSSASI